METPLIVLVVVTLMLLAIAVWVMRSSQRVLVPELTRHGFDAIQQMAAAWPSRPPRSSLLPTMYAVFRGGRLDHDRAEIVGIEAHAWHGRDGSSWCRSG